ncbi:aminoglycoside phosphotransferase family protein [Phytomonospora endophytica]|uniref:Streptomycin 6-kinase n=1 Tax=Phytomonospora endophytica TaxID=714109 RepID=A0A841FD93_9ACTN|nr:aminoglycoside phosphotransferase family protein [Phytomonospora endophytica]MBB6035251.1 streptomycin 6-kinase [Phytomonospora endophytica]
MTRIEVPTAIVDAARRRWPDRADAWAHAVRVEFPALLWQYGARPVTVHAGRYAYVAEVRARGGARLIFRASPDPAGEDQASVAVVLAKLGVSPAVHEVQVTETGCWTVMDRVEPGTPLGNTGASALSAAELGAILRPLAGKPAPLPNLPYIGDWLRSRLEDDHLADLAPGRAVAPRGERDAALMILNELASTGERGLCHGDTSPGNILKAADRKHCLIDPRGMCGEINYDVAVLGLKAARAITRPSRSGAIALAADVDVARTMQWELVAMAARV